MSCREGSVCPEVRQLIPGLHSNPTYHTEVVMAAKAKQSKRELIDTGTDKRYVTALRAEISVVERTL